MTATISRILASIMALLLLPSIGGAAQIPERPDPAATQDAASAQWSIRADDKKVEIAAGALSRNIRLESGAVASVSLKVAGHECLTAPAREFSLTVTRAEPNRKPQGLRSSAATTSVNTTKHFAPDADSTRAAAEPDSGVAWVEPVKVEAGSWSALFAKPACLSNRISSGVQRLTIRASAAKGSPLEGLDVDLCYEIYDGYPVIRKWVEVTQRGACWLKLERLVIDDIELSASCGQRTLLTPSERGAGASVVAMGAPSGEYGLIAVSEIPSALRQTRDTGAMGYAESLFEWVLAPGASFVSEPVFHFAYHGAVTPTPSAVSTPLDRAVEGPYMEFLRKRVGVASGDRTILSPQWCSWTNFKTNLSNDNVLEQAQIAARCGFALVLLDQGWQRGLIGTEPDPRKFPDFAATCRQARALGVELGLWVSSYRSADSPDLKAMPEARCLPLISRDGGFGMAYASPWKKYCAENLAEVSRRYGVRYFKQDFTNIKFGDVAEGHESLTRKESLLRGLRGLLETQDLLRKAAPDVTSEMTHEIYWGTPGVPCDVAAVKHCAAYHIPPNDYAGAGPSGARVNKDKPADAAKMRGELLAACFRARQRFYEHRGLPLYALEYYAAHAVNIQGSLTPATQDRQVCSWLMGIPSTFAGDLASLTNANIAQYRKRFDLIKRLERDYGIFRLFQFSGVPAPTEQDWHWWGKLTPDKGGAVVVLRGRAGLDERIVNIPWALPERTYQVTAELNEKSLGKFTGRQLQEGAIRLSLPPLGQEILELKLEP